MTGRAPMTGRADPAAPAPDSDPRAAFDHALDLTRALHRAHPQMNAFCDWDDTARWHGAGSDPIRPARALASDPGLDGGPHQALRHALAAIAPLANSTRTYGDDEIAPDFNDRFGSFPLVSQIGPFRSPTTCAYVLYAESALCYPWHAHPAEELYVVIAGQALFHRAGAPSRTLRPGDSTFHASDQPHAMDTQDHPVLCLVLWRGDLVTRPRLLPGYAP